MAAIIGPQHVGHLHRQVEAGGGTGAAETEIGGAEEEGVILGRKAESTQMDVAGGGIAQMFRRWLFEKPP